MVKKKLGILPSTYTRAVTEGNQVAEKKDENGLHLRLRLAHAHTSPAHARKTSRSPAPTGHVTKRKTSHAFSHECANLGANGEQGFPRESSYYNR